MSVPLRRLWRALGIEPGEERILLSGGAALFLAGWAAVSVANVSETFFLKRVGVELLPLVFLVNSLLLAGSSFGVGRLAVRLDHRRLLTWTFVALGLALVPLWLLVLADVTSVFALLVVAAKQMDSIALLVFWTAVGGLVSGRQGKRLFAPITAGGTLGVIFGSLASGPLGRALGIAALLPVAAAMLALAAVATLPLRRWTPRRLARPVRRPGVEDDPTRRLLPLWREGWLFRVLTVTALLAGSLGPVLYFQFSYVADLATQGNDGEQRLLDLYALVRAWINVGVLVIQLGGTTAAFRLLGVPLAAALSPLIYLLGLVGLSVRLSLPAGIAAMAAATLQDHAVYDPAQRILVTLFPERVRATVATLLEGPLKRAGGVFGNLLILGALTVGSPNAVGWVGLPIAGLWLVLALILWRAYPDLLLEVASGRAAGADETVPFGELLDAGTVRVLEQSLTSPDPARCRAARALIVEAPRTRAVGALARAARTAAPGARPLLVEALAGLVEDAHGMPVTSAEAAREVGIVLTTSEDLDALERATLVRAYGRLLGPAATRGDAHALLVAVAGDGHEAVRVAAIAAMHHAGAASPETDDLDSALRAALASTDHVARWVACTELRSALLRGDPTAAGWEGRLALLATQLAVLQDRPHVTAALAAIASHHGPRVASQAPAVLTLRTDADPRVRAAALRFVAGAGLIEHAGWVVEHLAADDRAEAAAARDALRTLAPAAIQVMLHTLRFGRRRARHAVLEILHAMPVDPASLRTLTDREVEQVRCLLLQRAALAAGSVSELVLQRLQERIDESVHTILMLLATVLDDARLARLCPLLGRARSARERALLLEALEAILPPAERERLLPLLEDRSLQALAETAAEALRRPLPSFADALTEVLASGDALTSALLASTLDPTTLARYAPELDAVAAARLLVPRRAEAGRDGPGLDPPTPLVSYDVAHPAMLSAVEIILHLRSLDLFERLTTRQLTELVSVVEEATVPAGAAIVREGEFDESMYLIVTGRVQITKAGEAVAELGPREFFGEMAVFDGERRSATATALGPVRLLRLARHELFGVMEEQPAIAVTICQTLSRRLRELLDDRSGRAE